MYMVNLRLIDNKPEYYELIRELRTNPINVEGFIQNVEITNQQQISYMSKYGDHYKICLIDDIPVGFIGVVDKDIRFAVEPKYHGIGIGKFMVSEIIKENRDVVAKVKLNNIASRKVFEYCGFKIYNKDKEFLYFRL